MKRIRRNRRRGNRAGFTLMEVLLVAMILVILASMATYGYVALQKSISSNLVRSEIKSIQNACTAFRITHNSFPSKLEELTTPVQGMTRDQWGGPYLDTPDFNDAWNQAYKYSVDGQNDRVTITSAGPDKQFSTDDDITNTF